MSNRSLLILAIVALAFCSYLYFKGGDPGTKEKEEEAKRLVILDQDKIQRIELTNPAGTYVFQKNEKGKWDIEKPVRVPADLNAIGTLLSELEFSEKKRVIAPEELKDYQASLQQFGLKDPQINARFQTSKELVDLQVGNKTAYGNFYYGLVRDPKKQQIVVIDEAMQSQLAQNLDLWRNRQIFDFKNPETTAISLRRGALEVEVLKGEKEWDITKPIQEKAMPRRMQEYLSAVISLHAENFVSENSSDPAQYGLNTPTFILEVKLGDRSQILRVGKARDDQPGQVYAQFGDRPAVFTISQKDADEMGNLLDQIRPRQLFGLSQDARVNRIEITQGTNALVLEGKEGEENSWTVSGEGIKRRASALGANDIIQAMHMMEALSFYSSVDNPNAEFGLQKPSLTVKVQSETVTPEKTSETKVLFGSIKDNQVYAESSVLPFVVGVDKRFIEAFPKGIWGWFDRSLGLPPAADVTGMTWTQGTNVLTLSRGADGKWNVLPADKVVDPKFLDVQLAYLPGLKVLRWVGKAVKKDFLKPRFTLEIKTGTRSRQLLFGPKQSDGSTLAKMSDDDFAFLLSDQDVQKLIVRPVLGEPGIPLP